jgi:hypothetical protein
MTEEEATALGKRLVACKGFRPMRGMLDMHGRTWDASLLWRWSSDVDVPDLRDPATLGCVLALVREAYDCSTCFAMWDESEEDWSLNVPHEGGGSYIESIADSEAEALVAALEAAP